MLDSVLLHLLESVQKSRFPEKRHLSWDLALLRKVTVTAERHLPLQGGGEEEVTASELGSGKSSISGEIASLPLLLGVGDFILPMCPVVIDLVYDQAMVIEP